LIVICLPTIGPQAPEGFDLASIDPIQERVHIPDHRLAALIHMHMLDTDQLRVAISQAP
jgi:hypothetical protein